MRKSSSNLSTHFGAIIGTYWLGPVVVESVLMPLHDQYIELLEKKMEEYSKSKSSKNLVSGTSACNRCRYALNRAVGTLLRYKISHHSRFSKSEDLKSRLNGLREGTNFERRYRDFQAMPLHINGHVDRITEQLGRLSLGMETQNPF